ncbi:MAG: ABC transporter permease [Candidatus Hodarchaeales archaeon]
MENHSGFREQIRPVITSSMYIPILSLLLIFYIPLLIIFFNSFFSSTGSFTIEYIKEALFSDVNQWIIRFTLNQAILSTFLTIILGLPGAYIFARYSFKGKQYLLTLFTIPFVLPPIVVVLGFILLFGPDGFMNTILRLFFPNIKSPLTLYKSFEGILVVHAFYNIPIVLRLVSSAWSNINVEMEEVATTLGSRGIHFFRNITFPQISTALLASGILTFLYTFTSFAIVLSLGGVQYRTIEVRIFSLYFHRYYYNQASALALVQLVITSILIISYLFISEKSFRREENKSHIEVRVLKILKSSLLIFFLVFLIIIGVNLLIIGSLAIISIILVRMRQISPTIVSEIRKQTEIPLNSLYSVHKPRLFIILSYIIFLILLLLLPIILVFMNSFYNRNTGNIDFMAIPKLLGFEISSSGLTWVIEPIPALGVGATVIGLVINSLILAFLTMILSVLLGVLAIYITRRSPFFTKHSRLSVILSWSLLLPLVISSITMGLGLLELFNFIRIPSNLPWIPLTIAHIIAAFPFVSRSISAAYNKISLESIEVGETLGGSRWYIFRHIELPLILPGALTGAIFALAISFGEFGATYLMARSDFSTMTVGIYKFLDIRQLQNSAIMASILIIICVIAFLIIQKTGNEEYYL